MINFNWILKAVISLCTGMVFVLVAFGPSNVHAQDYWDDYEADNPTSYEIDQEAVERFTQPEPAPEPLPAPDMELSCITLDDFTHCEIN
jgi:hypothetical protein